MCCFRSNCADCCHTGRSVFSFRAICVSVSYGGAARYELVLVQTVQWIQISYVVSMFHLEYALSKPNVKKTL